MNQLELHKKIDTTLKSGPKEANVDEINVLIKENQDARLYFFTQADERWLEWLWDNGFLDSIKQKTEDPTRYSYSMPELNYLDKVTPKKPEKVADIIIATPISKENFNPEVVDRFARIASNLSAEQLKRVAPRIKEQRWIPLMGGFGQFGFEYKKMFETLTAAKDYDNVLVLADAILTIRSKEEMRSDANSYVNENPFYFSDLEYTNVFEYLISVDSQHKEKAFELTLNTIKSIILTSKEKDEKVFKSSETFHLYDVDFFEIQLGEDKRISYRDDVHSLAATAKILAEDLIGKQCSNRVFVQSVYKKYIEQLPDTNSLWRFRLYVLSLCPQVFKEDLKKAFFRIFETEFYYELITGTEYKKTLQKGFSVLDEPDKREYIKQVFNFFSKKVESEEEQQWRTRYALQILSCICNELEEGEPKECEEKFGRKCDPNYQPEPSISKSQVGTIRPRGPITIEEFSNLPISGIVAKLKDEWKPEKLRSQNTTDDFHTPLNAEGVGNLIKEDLVKRLQEYIDNAALFFDRGVLDSHYTYSLFRGIEEIFREKKIETNNINWDGLIKLCLNIKESAGTKPFPDQRRSDRDIYGGWLASWTGVHSVIADVLLPLITEKNGVAPLDFPKHRDELLAIISYLLTHSDPSPEDEKIETAKIKTKSPNSDEYELGDPHTTAINSVRGRAFQVLTSFIYLDGKKYAKEAKVKIADDVKEIYEATLNRENTQALMFMFGHYLPSFYYRHKEWIRGLLPKLFPEDINKKDLYVAAWEGYLSANLYEEMFFDELINKLYYRALELDPAEYTKRRYVKKLDEGLGIHLALAFMYYNDFNFESDLYKKFWKDGNTNRYGSFISFIGRSFVSGDNKQSDKLLEENGLSKQKLHDFWEWALEKCADKEASQEFGFWMNAEKGVFDISWQAKLTKKTLEKTDGIVEWDFGLMRSMPTFAKSAPNETLEILRLLVLEGGVRAKKMQRPFYMDNELYEAFDILHKNGDKEFKEKVYKLIDDLIREGGSTFWKLKDIFTEQ